MFAVFGIFANRSRELLVAIIWGLLEYWQRNKRAEVNWKAFRRLASPVRKDHLWTFLDAEGIEPTNI